MKCNALLITAFMATASAWSFAAGGIARRLPNVITVPADSATAIPLNQRLNVTFRKAVNPLTVNAQTFTLQQRGMPIFGTVAAGSTSATFTPLFNLKPLTQYTARLTSEVRTISDPTQSNDIVWNFTTGPAVLSPQLPVNLGTAGNFVVLAGSAISFNGGASSITGDIGLSPSTGAAITAVTPPTMTGTIYTVDGLCAMPDVMDVSRLTTAKNDLTTAYIDAAGRVTPDTIDINGANLGGQTLAPGLHKFTTSAGLSGSNLTLSGPATGVWIFQIGSTLTVASGMRVMLAGGATWDNVFWQVGSSATMISGSHMEGTIMAMDSIDFGTTATMNGRALARNAAVTFAGGFGGGLPAACATLAPATLNAVANTLTNSIDLSWATVAGATSYNLYRATVSGGPYTLRAAVTAPTTNFSDTTVVAGTTYFYVVRAVSGCESVNSPQASAMLPAACATLAPATLSAVANTLTNSIDLSWATVVGATSYNLYRATVSGGPYTLRAAVTAPTTIFSDTTVVAGTTYFYVVRAVNGCESVNSPQASAMLPAVCATLAPATLSAVANTALSRIDLSWGTVAGATSYNIYRSTLSGGPYTLITAVTAPTTTYSDSMVLLGVTYFYVVRAVSGCESVNSPQSSAALPAACFTSAPSFLNVYVNAGEHTGIGLTWGAVAGATSYKIYRAPGGGSHTLVKTVLAPTTTWSDTNIVAGIWYYYYVRAFSGCDSANSPEGNAVRNCL